MRILMPFALAACAAEETGHDHSSHSHGSYEYVTTAATDGLSFLVSYTAEPEAIPTDDYFAITATVFSASESQTPLTDVTVEMDADMPSHDHGMNVTPEVIDNGDGTHTGEPFLFHMTGDWRLVFAVTQGDTVEIAEMYVDCCE